MIEHHSVSKIDEIVTIDRTRRMRASIAWCFAFLVSLALSATGQHKAERGALLTYLQVGNARVALTSDTIVRSGRRVGVEESTFDEVRRMLAPAAQSDSGDAASSLRWICYRLAGDSVSLVLESDEMGGGDYIDGFELIPAGSRPDLERSCARLSVPPQLVQTDRGIRLSLTSNQVRAKLGAVGRDSAGVVVFERSRDRVTHARDGTPEPYTESSGFIIRFRHGRVAEVHGWRVDAT